MHPWLQRIRNFIALSGLRLVDVATGIIKDVLLTRIFGLGVALDAYFVGTSFLDMASGYYQQMGYGILLPLHNRHESEIKTQEEIEANQQALTVVFMNYMTLTMVLVAMGMALGHAWISVWTVPNQSTAQDFIHPLFMLSLPISMLFQGSFALRTLLLQQKRFHLFYWPGIVSTLAFIGIFLALSKPLGNQALLWALPISQAIQVAMYWFSLKIRWQWLWKAPQLKTMAQLALPNALICVVYYLFTPVDNYFLAQLPPGELSAYRYAAKMVTVLSTLTIFSLQMTLIPALMKAGSEQKMGEMKRFIFQGLKESLLFSIPVIIGVLAFATPIVRLVFERGAFTADDTAHVVHSMGIQILALPYIGAWMLVSRCFNSLFYVKEFLAMGVLFLLSRVAMDYWGLCWDGMDGIAWMTTLHSYVMLVIGLGFLWILVQKQRT